MYVQSRPHQHPPSLPQTRFPFPSLHPPPNLPDPCERARAGATQPAPRAGQRPWGPAAWRGSGSPCRQGFFWALEKCRRRREGLPPTPAPSSYSISGTIFGMDFAISNFWGTSCRKKKIFHEGGVQLLVNILSIQKIFRFILQKKTSQKSCSLRIFEHTIPDNLAYSSTIFNNR